MLLTKEIGNLMKQGKKEEAEQLKQEVFSLKENLAEINGKLIFIEIELQDKLVLLPNLPAEIVPHGKSAEDNITVKKGGIKPNLPVNAKPHWDLITQYNLVDFEIGSKLTGRGFPLYKGKGAKLQRALVQFFLVL